MVVAIAVAVAATFLREGRLPPRSSHPRHLQHKLPLRRGGAAARRGRRRVKVEEPPRPPPLPSSSVSSSTTVVVVGELPPSSSPPLPLPPPREHNVLDEMLALDVLLLLLWMHCP
jgi:hypothetical protein